MPCYSPFSPDGVKVVACKQCIGCKLEHSRQWAVRCAHESSLHSRNCFLTLTYSQEHLPAGGTLVPADWELFMRRLRKFAARKLRFFMCGEYGERWRRPHYHALVFGFDFDDKVLWRNTAAGFRLYRSRDLERLWPLGHSSVGSVSFESAGYVARYVTKKFTSPGIRGYEHVDVHTGEVFQVVPEFARMSRRPGIGAAWFERFRRDVYPHGYVEVEGRKMGVPEFYRRRERARTAAVLMPSLPSEVRAKSAAEALPGRLEAREAVAVARLGHSKRSLD